MPASVVKAEEMRQRYLKEAVVTATPAMRLVMLYDRLVLDLHRVDDGFERGDFKTVNDSLCRSQDILLALRGTLRTDIWDGAAQLSQMYFLLYRELIEANMAKDRAQVQRVAAVVESLAAAWHRAAEQESGRGAGNTAGAAS